jgi:hypothetical protein
MRKLLFLGALLCAASITASCFNPQPDPPYPQPEPPDDGIGAGGSSGTKTGILDAGSGGATPEGDADAAPPAADADSGDPCPDWFGNKPGEPCNVSPAIECGGNAAQWASYCFLRCCGGSWLGPSDVDGCGRGAPPCP